MQTNQEEKRNPVVRAILLGAISGMRSMAGVALVTAHASRRGHESNLKGTLLGPATSRRVAGLARLAAVGEVVADKLPFLPNRIDPMPLFGRAQMGALTGAASFVEAKRSGLVGALLGALAAVGSAFLFYNLRVQAARLLTLPDPVVALFEDGLVLGLGSASERLA